ncbi:DUF1430 domain-containing protein [Actinoplanes sp. NBRC 101535]|uniref:bacteriocin-associated integral membrane family protein n=1 Tax=Actinoplanes sp. NBRC 101535 TaxID=3032196 RepID=UPI0024A5E3BE|nr:DUF1430 domain-containing protein [Actinoplanes sp. NBRC 101535]GLY06705.1 hypothetical protein Acsp01_70840 [Actinoplanes sp. NBRC 101535]
MKKTLTTLLLLLISGLAFAIAYVATDEDQRTRVRQAAGSIGETVTIRPDPRLADPALLYPALEEAATDAGVNLFRTVRGATASGTPQATTYLLITTGQTALYDSFDLTAGRWPTAQETHSDGWAVSTEPGQTGTLRDFGGNDVVTVQSLRSAFDQLPTAGEYTVEGSADRFAAALVSRLAAAGTTVTAADLTAEPAGQGSADSPLTALLTTVLAGLILLTTLMLTYWLLHESKRVAVMKLTGLGTTRIWYETSGRLILITLTASVVAALAAATAVPGTTPAFGYAVLVLLARAYLVMLAASLLTCVLIGRIRLSDSIKNRRRTGGVFAVNAVLKVACTVALVATCGVLWARHTGIAAEQERLDGWAASTEYGTFSPVSVGDDQNEIATGQPAMTAAEVYDLYPALNEAGALYVDATDFADASAQSAVPSLRVNPNYLRAYPVKDTTGRPVVIDESTSDWIVLVPERHRDREAEITAALEQSRGTGPDSIVRGDARFFGRTAPDAVLRQHIRIVRVADGQRAFSFDPAVNQQDGNTVLDPVIQVMTSANSVGLDRVNMITGDAGGALKVRLSGGDGRATLASLRPTLERLRLDDNLRHLVTMSEDSARRLAELRAEARTVLLAAAGVTVAFLALTAESIVLIFMMVARRVAVRRLFGTGFLRRYRELLAVLAAMWLLQLGLVVAVGPAVAGTPVLLVAGLAVIAVEAFFSYLVLTAVERRNLVQVLKGEVA